MENTTNETGYNHDAKLSPPWITYFNFLKHSVGNDPCVDVLDIEEATEDFDYLVKINVKGRERAAALATILNPCKEFGNVIVRIKIMRCGREVEPIECPQDLTGLARVYKDAFCTNRYFNEVKIIKIFGASLLFPIFKKEVIQFFNDDISDYYNNYNGVAADVFAEVLIMPMGEITVNPTTAMK